jgi:hypothetical protein
MLDLTAMPPLDKFALIGAGCARLPLRVDAERIRAEMNALPAPLWGTRGGRGGVHDRASAVWLRGHAPAERRSTIDEREPFAWLPTLRELVMSTIPAPPMRCLLARLPAGGSVPAHTDNGPYFERTVRLHVPIITSPRVTMFADGLVYRMQPGEVWALNNSAIHGVLNDDPVQARTHMIVDFLPSDGLRELLRDADRGLGVAVPEVEARLEALHRAGAAGGAGTA